MKIPRHRMNTFFGVKIRFDARQAAFKVAAIFALVAGAWSVLSDELLWRLVRDRETLLRMDILKELCFDLVTAMILFWLVQRTITALRREDERLREIAQGVSVATGEALFTSLARHLAQALDADCALVCELTGGGNERMRTLAAYVHGRVADNSPRPSRPCRPSSPSAAWRTADISRSMRPLKRR